MLVAMARSQQSDDSIQSVQMTDGLLQLPSLSPLSGPQSLRATPVVNHIASELKSRGYGASFAGGTFRLSSGPGRSLNLSQDLTSYLSLMSTPAEARRPRTAPTTFLCMKPLQRTKDFRQGADDACATGHQTQTADNLQFIRSPGAAGLGLHVQGSYSAPSSPIPPASPLGRPFLKPPMLDPHFFGSNQAPPALSSPGAQHQLPWDHPSTGMAPPPALQLPQLQHDPAAGMALGSRPSTAMSCTLVRETEQLGAQVASRLEAEQASRLSPGASRPGTPSGATGPWQQSRGRQAVHPMARWKPTRAHALLVFHAVDGDKNGKVTQAEFEDAAISIGFSDKQAANTFRKLDWQNRGYLEYTDWGRRELASMVEAFTTMYMHRHMGLPDITAPVEQVKRYFYQQKTREVKSLPAAINLARVNAVARGTCNSSGASPIYEAFRFIDIDGSGDLSRNELRDGFFAMGVHLADHVVDQIMDVFDEDGSGSVNFYEFVKVMFPKLGKGMG